jgi:hypothetical protein
MFPSDLIEDENIFKKSIKSILVWLFVEEILLVFFTKLVDGGGVFFEILLMFFLGKPA